MSKVIHYSEQQAILRQTFPDFTNEELDGIEHDAFQNSDHLRKDDKTIIAELRQKNQALQEAYSNLAEQDRLRTEFITTLSHELRTPLTAIQGFLHLIHQGVAQGQSLDRALESVNHNVDQMVRLTNNLLVLYEMHLSSPNLANLSVADLLVEAMQEARSMQENYLTPISLTMYPGATRLQGDKSSLLLVLRALIENALKFTPNNAPIKITVSKPQVDEICIEISDQGIGMSEDDLEHIFDPFFRVEGDDERLFAGLGVGLAITRFIMDRHGGRIEAESKPGKGSIFRLYLPYKAQSKTAVKQTIVEGGVSQKNGFRAGVYAVAATL